MAPRTQTLRLSIQCNPDPIEMDKARRDKAHHFKPAWARKIRVYDAQHTDYDGRPVAERTGYQRFGVTYEA